MNNKRVEYTRVGSLINSRVVKQLERSGAIGGDGNTEAAEEQTASDKDKDKEKIHLTLVEVGTQKEKSKMEVQEHRFKVQTFLKLKKYIEKRQKNKQYQDSARLNHVERIYQFDKLVW